MQPTSLTSQPVRFPLGGCMKTTLKLLTLFALLSMTLMLHGSSVTVGNYDSGNCYPFMCNDSGTNVGQSIDYQQAYNSAAFGGPITVSSISWYYARHSEDNDTILGGATASTGVIRPLALGLPAISLATMLAHPALLVQRRYLRAALTMAPCLPSRDSAPSPTIRGWRPDPGDRRQQPGQRPQRIGQRLQRG